MHLAKYLFCVAGLMIMCCTLTSAQEVDSIQYDLDHLTDSEFFRRYSLTATPLSASDIEVTKMVWSQTHIKIIATENKLSRGMMMTMINERPFNTNPYFVVGLYRVASRDHVVRIGNYRVDTVMNLTQFQKVPDDKWVDVN